MTSHAFPSNSTLEPQQTHTVATSTAQLELQYPNSTAAPIDDLVQITPADVLAGGLYLLPLSTIFTFVNGFLSYIIYRSWSQIKKSRSFNSYLLGSVLIGADLALALLVGVPAGLHLTWSSYFRKQPAMIFYSKIVGYLIFEYIFLLRVLIVVVLSVDGCLHILLPIRYMAADTKKWAQRALIGVFLLPLIVKVIPGTVVLSTTTSKSKVTCLRYGDPSLPAIEQYGTAAYDYAVPLTCGLDFDHLLPDGREHETVNVYSTVDVIIQATTTATAWLVITGMNVAIMSVLFKNAFHDQRSTGKISSKNSVRRRQVSCLGSVAFLSFTIISFTATNLPTVCVWWADYLFRTGIVRLHINSRHQLFLILLLFLSLLFHPWLYLLRMSSFRHFVTGLKVSILDAISQSVATEQGTRVKAKSGSRLSSRSFLANLRKMGPKERPISRPVRASEPCFKVITED